ncbi:MAG: sigma factor, partial [Verrucomicrobiota bacterium]
MSDSEALALYSIHREKLIGYANKIVRDSYRAEDIVQDAFLKFRKAKRSAEEDHPSAYLYRIVRNLAL